MCLIVHSPVGHKLSADIIESALDFNSDGAGLMYWDTKNNRIQIWKNASPTVKDVTSRTDQLTDTEYAIHFRMRTHGKIDQTNTHPYQISKRRYLMHNGILTHPAAEGGPEFSDTLHYINNRIRPALAAQNLDWTAIGEEIGTSNKFAVLEGKKLTVVNRDHGLEYDGAWFSNTYAWDAPLGYYDYPRLQQDEGHWDIIELIEEVRNLVGEQIFSGAIEVDRLDPDATYNDIYKLVDRMSVADLADCITQLRQGIIP